MFYQIRNKLSENGQGLKISPDQAQSGQASPPSFVFVGIWRGLLTDDTIRCFGNCHCSCQCTS